VHVQPGDGCLNEVVGALPVLAEQVGDPPEDAKPRTDKFGEFVIVPPAH
jgi:hypothetical protein